MSRFLFVIPVDDTHKRPHSVSSEWNMALGLALTILGVIFLPLILWG
jgi:hypothetical protein